MPVQIEKVSEPVVLGEGPHWCASSKSLYFVDVISSSIHRYEPATGKTYKAQVDQAGSIILPVAGQQGQFVVTMGRSLVRISWDGVSSKIGGQEVLAEVDSEPGKEGLKFNDGKVDTKGRIWAGTTEMSAKKENIHGFVPKSGSLYSLSPSEGLVSHAKNITLSNGIVWSLDSKTMYYIDTFALTLDAFDFDVNTPTLSNRRSVFDMEANGLQGLLDGMTIDSDGNLWVAVFGGAQLLNIDPRTGTLIRKVAMPALQPTSVAFGGTNLGELYVTSTSYKMSEEELKTYPLSGATFRVTGLGVKGLPMMGASL